jgi:hypothetical protein
MDKKIEKQFRRMAEKKNSLLSMLRPLAEEVYNRKPLPGKWSPGQIANHLYLSEKFSLAYLRKKMSYPETIPEYHFKSWLKYYAYKTAMPFLSAKAPKTINMWEGQDVLSPAELDVQWEALRNELRDFISEKYPAFKNHSVYNHPFAGRLTMEQMLIFFNDHIDHHTKQLRRILKKGNRQ